MIELVRVEELKPGDEVEPSPRIGPCVVSEVKRYDDGPVPVFVVVYFRTSEAVYENRARDRSGHTTRPRIVERSLRPMVAGDRVRARRGSPGRAERLRGAMLDQQADREQRAFQGASG